MAFIDQVALAQDITFKSKVVAAITKSAIAIQSEAEATASHQARTRLAFDVLRDPVGFAALMAYGVTQNAAITALSTDSDIEFTINSVWNAYAVRN